MRKLVSAAAIASIAAITWQRLSDQQRQSVVDAVKVGRRKLANYVAPKEDLGDLTNCVDPEILEILTVELQKEEEAQTKSE
jgi:hypothetical protein